MVGALGRRHAHAERDAPRDLAHDRLDAAEPIQIAAHEVGLHRLVAAVVDDDALGKERLRRIAGRDVPRLGETRVPHLAHRNPHALAVDVRLESHAVPAPDRPRFVERMVDEPARNVVPSRHLGDDLGIGRIRCAEDLDLGLRRLATTDHLAPLPGDARRARSGKPLLDGAAETDLLEKAQLLVLAADDLNEVVPAAHRERAAEAERHQQVDHEPCRDRVGLLDGEVREAATDEPRRRHLGAGEDREEQGPGPGRRVEDPLDRPAVPHLAARRRAELAQLRVERHGVHTDVELRPPSGRAIAPVDAGRETNSREVVDQGARIGADRCVDRDLLAVTAEVTVTRHVAQHADQRRIELVRLARQPDIRLAEHKVVDVELDGLTPAGGREHAVVGREAYLATVGEREPQNGAPAAGDRADVRLDAPRPSAVDARHRD
jgi:hypothetical protein